MLNCKGKFMIFRQPVVHNAYGRFNFEMLRYKCRGGGGWISNYTVYREERAPRGRCQFQ